MSGLFNVSLDDTSPVFVYQPYGEGGGLTQGWATYYTNGGGFVTASGAIPRGDSPPSGSSSYHVTAFDGASVSLSFTGSSVWLFGTSNCTYDITLDSNTQRHTVLPGEIVGDVLASYTGLSVGDHTISLRPHPSNSSQRLMFDRGIVTIDTGNSPTAFVSDVNASSVVYTPPAQWQLQNDAGVPFPFEKTSWLGGTANLDFSGRAVAVYGSLNWGHQLYNVTLDGQAGTALNGSSYWKVGETLLYLQSGLNPSTSHNIKMINAVAGGVFTVTRFQVWQDSTPGAASSKSSSHTGAIVGGVVAAVAVVVLLLLLFLLRRSRRRESASRNVTGAEVMATPWIEPHNPGAIYTDRKQNITSPSRTSLMSSPLYSQTMTSHSAAMLVPEPIANVHPAVPTAAAVPPPAPVLPDHPPLVPDIPVPTVPTPDSQERLRNKVTRILTGGRQDGASTSPGPQAPAIPSMRQQPAPTATITNAAGVRLTPDAMEQILQQLAARIDHGASSRDDLQNQPPAYSGGRS